VLLCRFKGLAVVGSMRRTTEDAPRFIGSAHEDEDKAGE
jgi:hypothetical protein